MPQDADRLRDISQLSATFTDIYDRGLWGRDSNIPYYSGVGSHQSAIVEPYLAAVRSFVGGIEGDCDAVDLGCGDFSVGSALCDMFRSYTACDIVEGIIDYNRVHFASLAVSFVSVDVVNDPLPRGNIAFIRQVLQHLSNRDIVSIVKKLYDYQYVIVTEHLPSGQFRANVDKVSGVDIRPDFGSGVILTGYPFCLKVKDASILCEAVDNGGIIRTTAYRL